MAIGMSNAAVWSYFYQPLACAAVLLVLMLLLRWSFSRHRSATRAPAPEAHRDFGLLVAMAPPGKRSTAESMQTRLSTAGVTCTLVETTRGLMVMVFDEDADRARDVLTGGD